MQFLLSRGGGPRLSDIYGEDKAKSGCGSHGQGQGGLQKVQAGDSKRVRDRSATLPTEEENDGRHCVYAGSPMAWTSVANGQGGWT